MVYFSSRFRILQSKIKNNSPQSEICHHLPVGYSHIKVTGMFVESLGVKKAVLVPQGVACCRLSVVGDEGKKRASERA